MSAHRYWRIYCFDFPDDYCSVGEIEFRTAIDGSQAATGGTAISGGDYSASYPPSMAFNGVYSTTDDTEGWISTNPAATAWLGYDWGVGNSVDILEVAIWPRALKATNCPPSFRVESSDDGINWTTVWVVLSASIVQDTLNQFPYVPLYANVATTKARFLVLEIEDPDTKIYAAVSELQLRQSLGGVDETSNTGGTVLFSSEYNNSTFAATNVVDDDVSTKWAGSFSSGSTFIGFEFSVEITLREYTFTHASTDDGQSPISWIVQLWDAGAGAWHDVAYQQTPPDWGVSETRTFSLPDPTTVALPVMDPSSDTVSSGSTVTITCATDGATIYYTMDGSEPTIASAVYSAPIEITTDTTIKAFAVASGLDDSAVVTESYVVSSGQQARMFVIT